MVLENDVAKPYTYDQLCADAGNGVDASNGADGEHVCGVTREEFDIPDYYKWTKAELDHEAKMFVTMTKKACTGSYKMTVHDKVCFECFKRAFERLMTSDVEVQDYTMWTNDELLREVDRLGSLLDGAAQGQNPMSRADHLKIQALADESKQRRHNGEW